MTKSPVMGVAAAGMARARARKPRARVFTSPPRVSGMILPLFRAFRSPRSGRTGNRSRRSRVCGRACARSCGPASGGQRRRAWHCRRGSGQGAGLRPDSWETLPVAVVVLNPLAAFQFVALVVGRPILPLAVGENNAVVAERAPHASEIFMLKTRQMRLEPAGTAGNVPV